MYILTIRTDKPVAEIGLFQDDEQLAYDSWTAHRELGRTLHAKLSQLLESAGRDLHDVQGIVAFQGPGSFTGLRIGLTVANTLAYALPCAIVAAMGDDWIADGRRRLQSGESDGLVMPEYGAEANITTPRN